MGDFASVRAHNGGGGFLSTVLGHPMILYGALCGYWDRGADRCGVGGEEFGAVIMPLGLRVSGLLSKM